jgi:hypothetical protein
MTGLRDLIRDNIGGVLAVFDEHEAGIYSAEDIGTEEDRYSCPQKCAFIGTQSEWCDHLADKLADALEAK